MRPQQRTTKHQQISTSTGHPQAIYRPSTRSFPRICLFCLPQEVAVCMYMYEYIQPAVNGLSPSGQANGSVDTPTCHVLERLKVAPLHQQTGLDFQCIRR